MPFYENVIIARPDLSVAQAEEIADAIEKTIKGAGGKVAKRESWGLRTLASPIKKTTKGYYVLQQFEADAKAVAELDKSLRYNQDLLRYMTLRIDAISNDDSPILSQNDSRESRGGRR